MIKNLCVRETYEKDGVQKTSWNTVGILFDGKNGKQYVKLYHMPGVLVSVFEPKEKTPIAEKEQDETGGVNW